MNALASLSSLPMTTSPLAASGVSANKPEGLHSENPELKKAFTDFVGQTFYSQMLQALRSTVDKPAYFHGGQAEEIFQNQMDQILSERLAETSADHFAGPMFDLFRLQSR